MSFPSCANCLGALINGCDNCECCYDIFSILLMQASAWLGIAANDRQATTKQASSFRQDPECLGWELEVYKGTNVSDFGIR